VFILARARIENRKLAIAIRAMKVGILQVDLQVGDALTVRDKRRIVKSLRDRWRHRHNVSVAEVEFLEHPRQARLGVAMVGLERRQLESALAGLVECLRREPRLELLDFQLEII
jgi:uncharacterized protein YlxP (DUF503 family)